MPSESAQVLIVGGGPSGMAVAACLRARGLRPRIVDSAGRLGGAYREMHREIRLASTARHNALPLLALDGDDYLTASDYQAYLERYAEKHALTAERACVCALSRKSSGFSVEFVDGSCEGVAAVVVATGMWSFPRLPTFEGADAPRVLLAKDWRGVAAHPAERVLVLGAGTSGVEIAEENARAGRAVLVSARKPPAFMRDRLFGRDIHDFAAWLEKLPPWLARKHCVNPPTHPPSDHGFSVFSREGRIRIVPRVARLDASSVTFEDGSRAEVDLVVAALGYRFDTTFLPPEVARHPGGHVQTRHGESLSSAGLFVVGSPCAGGLGSEFLRGVARDAPVIADAIAARVR